MKNTASIDSGEVDSSGFRIPGSGIWVSGSGLSFKPKMTDWFNGPSLNSYEWSGLQKRDVPHSGLQRDFLNNPEEDRGFKQPNTGEHLAHS